MRKIFIISLLLFSSSLLFAKNLKPEEVKYQEIVEFPGMDANLLYEKAKSSLVNHFKSSKAVIQYEDKEQGRIKGRAWTEVYYALTPVNTWFTITIDVKDEKLRITFTDMRLPDIVTQKEDTKLMYLPMQLEKFSKQAKAFVESMKNEIISDSENDDW